MLRTVFIALVLLRALSACAPKDHIYDGPDGDYGKSLFSELQARNVKSITERFDPKQLAGKDPSVFDKMAGLFPPTPPRSVTVVFRGNDDTGRRVYVNLQYEFENLWLLASATWRKTANGDTIIEGMTVQPLPDSLQQLNSFQLRGKDIAHYTIFVFGIALSLLSLIALILCIRTPLPCKRKILWCLGILVSFGRVGVNWSSGAISIIPAYVQLFLPGNFVRLGPFAPYMVSVSVPVFAILFLWWHRDFEGAEAAGSVPPSAASER